MDWISGFQWEVPSPATVFLLVLALWAIVAGLKKILGAVLVAALIAAAYWWFVMPLLA